VKQNDLLSVTSILSVLLLALHISQDIVFGFDRAGLNHLVGVAILLVVVCGAVLLRERPSGKVIMLLGGVMAAGMLPCTCGMDCAEFSRRAVPCCSSDFYVLGDRCVLRYPRGQALRSAGRFARTGRRLKRFVRLPVGAPRPGLAQSRKDTMNSRRIGRCPTSHAADGARRSERRG
jgi:hypothetical protein